MASQTHSTPCVHCENLCLTCAAGGQEALQPVEAMLAVASYPSNEIAEMSYTFWYRLSRHLTSPFASSDPIASLQVDLSHVFLTFAAHLYSSWLCFSFKKSSMWCVMSADLRSSAEAKR